ncbi:F0F1 ATP synthase subunit delta [Streptococcus cristatus]|jgi:ATP synthase F1, delta subunit|uniref:ATP synthase subunit delta n=1 Tax=Streptococcus cristatus TaxID=45634 RepID=A0A3R9L567_STRCR|nr:F0F1 ATP synthase subunit delta [Streptococcus cristatus]KAA0967592.1 F0F1 ATP synthase subunit delta [Streptococcus cristatus]RSJ91061.1 ATP synthase subunit delta [Streptococcus cristatus]
MDKKHYAVIEKYTLPFVQLVFEKGQQQDVFEKLSQIRAVFEETNLADFLSHIGVDDGEKEKALRLFQNSDSQLIDNFIEVVILNHRADLFYDMLVEIQHQIEKQSNEFEVTVKSVQALTDSQKERLKPMIEQKMGLKVRSLKQELDASLIGGFVISANNKTIDASIKRQLQLVKENLK